MRGWRDVRSLPGLPYDPRQNNLTTIKSQGLTAPRIDAAVTWPS